MGDADKSLKIELTATSQEAVQALGEAKAAVQDLKQTTESASQAQTAGSAAVVKAAKEETGAKKESGDASKEVGRGIDEQTGKTNTLHDAIRGVTVANRHWGHLLHILFNPLSAVIYGAAMAVHHFIAATREAAEAEKKAVEDHEEAVIKLQGSLDGAKQSAGEFKEKFAELQAVAVSVTEKFHEATEEIRLMAKLQDELTNSQMAIDIAKVDEDEAQGKRTHIGALEKKRDIRNAFDIATKKSKEIAAGATVQAERDAIPGAQADVDKAQEEVDRLTAQNQSAMGGIGTKENVEKMRARLVELNKRFEANEEKLREYKNDVSFGSMWVSGGEIAGAEKASETLRGIIQKLELSIKSAEKHPADATSKKLKEAEAKLLEAQKALNKLQHDLGIDQSHMMTESSVRGEVVNRGITARNIETGVAVKKEEDRVALEKARTEAAESKKIADQWRKLAEETIKNLGVSSTELGKNIFGQAKAAQDRVDKLNANFERLEQQTNNGRPTH